LFKTKEVTAECRVSVLLPELCRRNYMTLSAVSTSWRNILTAEISANIREMFPGCVVSRKDVARSLRSTNYNYLWRYFKHKAYVDLSCRLRVVGFHQDRNSAKSSGYADEDSGATTCRGLFAEQWSLFG
jgi:hypothetical protein